MMVLGLVHIVSTWHYFGAAFDDLRRVGIWNALDRFPNEPGYPFERSAAFWCLAYGFFMIAVGMLIRFAHVQVGRLPAGLGWVLLVFYTLAALLSPKAPFWLGIVFGIAALLDARPERPAAKAAQPSRS
jgi:hypothetical protein